jgi:hypothetical protein
MGTKTKPHKIESQAKDIVRSRINSNKNYSALFRELTERDYGIDAIVELFDDEDNPTGKFALLQIKGTSKTIVPLKNKPNLIPCSISTSNARYAKQNIIPVILIYVTLNKAEGFYFVFLQELLTDDNKDKLDKQKSLTVHIPIYNNAQEDLAPLFEAINEFYTKKA